ncbi:MAG: hypothetical protein UX92_C0009G0011 [Candidatus Amesbacteria bacterium GW2011_GWA1_47_20]|nr:MAG: hypothetical protein UX42_C0004G0024 [Microgenomates group bacterium GW2011_GWC1_46_20]KKU69801.1 MAG: hypothetical protein UX92_C0009G0011 [Candidatus Amesbacteria bacterium GW2011_GWA1_47_20]KKU83998.1 MAG: hypothetical protein UY11_C0008G0011 [Candidatus Amesbacteria bacterium GW2011_GWC2_47_8]
MAKVLVLVVLILGLGFSVYYLVFARGVWDGRVRFTVIDTSDKVEVASFDPKTSQGIKIIFPKNWLIGGVDGKGEWLAGQADRPDLVADELGILYTAAAKHMHWQDRVLWWYWGRRAAWREVDGTVWMIKARMVDGAEVWRLDDTWNAAARDLLASEAVLEERLSVTVVNTTGEPGLAAREAQKIENTGMRVVATQTSEDKISGCQVRSSKQSKSKIGVKLLVRSLGCSWREADLGEGEVELFLGQR